MIENKLFLLLLRQSLYDFASTLGLTRQDVKEIANRMGERYFTLPAHQLIRNEIQNMKPTTQSSLEQETGPVQPVHLLQPPTPQPKPR